MENHDALWQNHVFLCRYCTESSLKWLKLDKCFGKFATPADKSLSGKVYISHVMGFQLVKTSRTKSKSWLLQVPFLIILTDPFKAWTSQVCSGHVHKYEASLWTLENWEKYLFCYKMIIFNVTVLKISENMYIIDI